MQTILLIIQLLPAILAAIKSVEEAFPPGSGKDKLDTVLNIIRLADDTILNKIGLDKLISIINFLVSKLYPKTTSN